jgi:hypothetical protein
MAGLLSLGLLAGEAYALLLTSRGRWTNTS